MCLPVNYTLTDRGKNEPGATGSANHRSLSTRITSQCSERAAHWLAVLELVLPLFDQISGLAPCQGVCGRGRVSHGLQQRSKAVVDQCFCPGVLIGNAPGSFPVGNHVFLDLCRFAFDEDEEPMDKSQ